MKKYYFFGTLLLALSLTACGGGGDSFTKEMTNRMAKDSPTLSKKAIQECVEKHSQDLSQTDKDMLLSTVGNDEMNQDFSSMEELESALQLSMTFLQEVGMCAAFK